MFRVLRVDPAIRRTWPVLVCLAGIGFSPQRDVGFSSEFCVQMPRVLNPKPERHPVFRIF